MAIPRLVQGLSLLTIAVVAIGTSGWRGDQPAPSDWRERFAQAALQIPFDKDYPPQHDDSVEAQVDKIPARLANLRIAAARTRDTGQVARIDARITSDSGYARLGIAPGVNYIWKDFVGGHLRLLVIPANPKYRTHWLAVGGHNHPPPVRVPRIVIARDKAATKLAPTPEKRDTTSGPLVDASENPRAQNWALMALICTTDCTDGHSWCDSHDTTETRSLKSAELPIELFISYYTRNHVAWAAAQKPER